MTEVLDLDAVFERDEVKLNGKTYLLRNRQEFSILQWHRIVSLDGQGRRLAKTAASSEADAKKLSAMQRDLVAMLVVDLDPQDEIPDWACAAILRFWAERINPAGGGGGGEGDGGDPQSARTSAASSRGSKRSTAATRRGGSTSRSGR